jgi:hypothetical protein
VSLVTELCDLARRCLADDEQAFGDAAAAGDLQRASAIAGESFELATALKRQERMTGT